MTPERLAEIERTQPCYPNMSDIYELAAALREAWVTREAFDELMTIARRWAPRHPVHHGKLDLIQAKACGNYLKDMKS